MKGRQHDYPELATLIAWFMGVACCVVIGQLVLWNAWREPRLLESIGMLLVFIGTAVLGAIRLRRNQAHNAVVLMWAGIIAVALYGGVTNLAPATNAVLPLLAAALALPYVEGRLLWQIIAGSWLASVATLTFSEFGAKVPAEVEVGLRPLRFFSFAFAIGLVLLMLWQQRVRLLASKGAEGRILRDRDRLLQLLQDQMNAMPIACLAIDEQGRISYANPAAERIFQLRAQDTVGKQPHELLPWKTLRPEIDRGYALLRGGRKTVRSVVQHPLPSDRSIVCDWQVTALLRDGTIVGFLAMAQDITEQRKLEQHLRHAQKMEAIGQLAGGIAHDFNNLLAVIISYATFLLKASPPDGKAEHDSQQILKASERAQGLTNQLLAFSRRQVVAPQRVNPNERIAGLASMLPGLLGDEIRVESALAANLWMIRIDPTQLDQVLVNLAVNARDAMPRGGVLRISTRNANLENDEAAALGLVAGHYVSLEVADTGSGIPQAILPRIFEPFFSTKQPGQGSGLGLSTCYGIIQQAGGAIRVDSSEGRGTTLCVYIPRDSQSLGHHNSNTM